MAVLNNIRKHGIFLIVIIALALFAFILSSVIRNGGFSSNKDQNTIATINGEDVSRIDFSNRLQNLQQNSRRNMTTVQAVDQVWDNMVRQKLVEEQINKLGIDVGSSQINTALAQQFGQNPNFQTNGRFDIHKLRGYIEQMRANSPQAYQQWLMTEQEIVQQAKNNTYFNLVQAGLGATDLEAKQNYKLNNTTFDLQYVKIPYGSVDNSKVTISDKEIKTYINNHKKQFETKGSRDIRYVVFKEAPSKSDVSDVKKSLDKLLTDHERYNKAADMNEKMKGFKSTQDYETFLSENSDLPYNDAYLYKSDLPKAYADTLIKLHTGDFYGPYKNNGFWKYSKVVDTKQKPDSVKVKHILISYQGLQTAQGTDRTQAEAEELADSLLNVVKKDSTEFGKLVNTYSDDTPSKAKGGDLGWLPHMAGQTNPFAEFAFSHKAGESGVVQTQFGYHVVFVEDLKNMQKTIKLATLAKKIEPSSKTLNAVFNKTTKFQIAAKDGDFAQAAKDKNYEVRTVKNLGRMDENISGIGPQRNIVKWAFEKDTKPGAITRFDTDDGYVVVQLTGSTSKGLESVEEASAKVKPILLKEKKTAYLKNNISGDQLSAIAGQYGTTVQTKNQVTFKNPDLDGNEPKVVAHAFRLKKDEVSEPIAGENGVYIIKLMNKMTPAELPSYKGFKAEVTRNNEQHAYSEMIKALKDKAKINDRRAKFY